MKWKVDWPLPAVSERILEQVNELVRVPLDNTAKVACICLSFNYLMTRWRPLRGLQAGESNCACVGKHNVHTNVPIKGYHSDEFVGLCRRLG